MSEVMAKSISLFAPLRTKPEPECDEHYRQVHTPWARHMLRATGAVRSYHTAKAVARYDLNGRFRQRPTRWRYTMVRLDPTLLGGFGDEVDEAIAQDHLNFLQDYRGFSVTEEIALDRRGAQNSFAAYLFELDRGPAVEAAAGTEAAMSVVASVRDCAEDAYGIRAITVDTVVEEMAAEAMEHPGQRPLRRPLGGTDKLAVLEILFDQPEWAEEWFASPVFRAAIADPRLAVMGHAVEFATGFDNR